ncbi:MAG: efflux transporter outer membrane subunit, partial [Verrucomicrobiales bacterium]
MKHILRTTCLAAALLTACAPIGENYQEPEIPVPDSWNQAIRTGLSTSSPEITSWWRKFNDPTLNKLLSLSKSNNRELAIAAERITEARSQSKIARGGLSPFVAANGGVTRSRASESVSAFATNQDTYELGFSAGWEMDFVGGLRRSVEAARASAEATEELYHDTLVLIYAELASNYIQYRTLQRRIELAEANIGNQQKSVDLTRARKDAGLAPQIDVSQAETNLASSRALIPQLRTQQAATLNRIAVLIGSYPDQARRLLGTGSSIPTPPRSLATGLPSDLLRARPDIRAAERRVAAQHAALGVSKAELFPKFTLSGTLALQGANPGDLSDGASRAYSFGPGFRWRIFEGGIIKEEIKAQESRVRQA